MSQYPYGVMYSVATGMVDDLSANKRWLSQLAGVFTDENAYQRVMSGGDHLVYQVTNIEENTGDGQLHYGLGVLMPGRVGEEYFMTRGHIHAWRPAAEVYIGLQGQGIMLLQDEHTGECAAAPLSPSQMVYVPGHCAHRTINTGSEPLVYWGILTSEAGHDYDYVHENPFQKVVIHTENGPAVMDREQYRQQVAGGAR